MKTLRILFVDDEANVLQGLQRMLRSKRKEWEMEFAESGAKALELLHQAPFDVVVSDMRMPRMSGAELLQEVQTRHPHTVRFILSGHAEEEMILPTVGPTHQFLAKPCDSEVLKSSILRAVALRNLLGESRVREAVARLRSLPSLPSLFQEVVREIQSPTATVRSVASIVSRDIGMTAKILQLMNSAFFGLRREVTGMEQAVSLLGLGRLQSLILTAGAFSQFDPAACPGISIEALWNHSILTGTFAGKIARLEKCGERLYGHVFLGALLHDVGDLDLAGSGSGGYREVSDLSEREGIPEREAERLVYGCTHEEAGAYLLGLWGMSDPIVEALAYHHLPYECHDRIFGALTIVHVAEALAREALGGKQAHRGNGVSEVYLEALGCSDRLPAWREVCSDVVSERETK